MGLLNHLLRGRRHRNLLQQVETCIVVSGIRGKSSTIRRLHDIFYERGYDTFSKITGDFPITIYNGEESPIERQGPRVTLYENRHLLAESIPRLEETEPEDVVIFENHALTEYTMRVFNQRFTQPDIVLLTNIRQDHNDTLGTDLQTIARSFARSIPAGTRVVSGEQHEVINEYLEKEIQKRGASFTQVSIPREHRQLTGVETVYALKDVLRAANQEPLPEERLKSMLEGMQPEWVDVGTERVFNAAKVNDPESTELFRRQLAGDGESAELVCPFVFLRADRRWRMASFAEYIDILYERELIDRVHVGGASSGVFARKVEPPATEHDTENVSAADVLDSLLAEGQPIILMANTVHPFMREMQTVVNDRKQGTIPGRYRQPTN